MAKETLVTVVKRRLLGVLLIALVVGLISLSIAIYNKAFTDIVEVKLLADHTGNQLQLASDVKERGIIVGSVKEVRADGENAIVTLALDPGRVGLIPKNVTAQILPKTLFGEQYVALGIPNDSAGRVDGVRAIQAGDTIPQDRSQGAIEAQNVFGDLLPLLTAVQPAELNDTLNAISLALKDRGPKLGRVLTNFDRYLRIMNPSTGKLVEDLKKLGQVALEYNDVAPDIFATLQNLQTSAQTIITRRAALDNLLTTGSTTANVLQGFLADNEQRLIEVGGQSRKMYGLLAQYSPEFTCMFAGVNKLVSLAGDAVYDHEIHLSVTLDNTSQGKYKQGEEPRIVTGYGPSCFGLPNPMKPFQIPAKYRCLNDGAALTKDPCAQRANSMRESAIGSPQESAIVNSLIAHDLHTTPDKVLGGTTILVAPLLRGQQVVVK